MCFGMKLFALLIQSPARERTEAKFNTEIWLVYFGIDKLLLGMISSWSWRPLLSNDLLQQTFDTQHKKNIGLNTTCRRRSLLPSQGAWIEIERARHGQLSGLLTFLNRPKSLTMAIGINSNNCGRRNRPATVV